MTLPKWTEQEQFTDRNWGVQMDRYHKALAVACEALETWPVCEARRHCACSNVLAYRKKALAEIERIGGGK